MGLKPIGKPKVVEEVDYGVYIWEMPDGKWVGDDDGNFLNIPAMKGDRRKIAELTNAVRSYGVEEGAPKFLAGHRRVTDEEYEEQRQRLLLGLTPDEYDIPALMEDLKFRGKQ